MRSARGTQQRVFIATTAPLLSPSPCLPPPCPVSHTFRSHFHFIRRESHAAAHPTHTHKHNPNVISSEISASSELNTRINYRSIGLDDNSDVQLHRRQSTLCAVRPTEIVWPKTWNNIIYGDAARGAAKKGAARMTDRVVASISIRSMDV